MVSSESCERLSEVVLVNRFFFTLDEHIVYVHFQVPPDLFIGHLVYQPLIGCSCIFLPKGNHFIVVEPLACDEGSFLPVFLCHFYLVVP